MSIGHFELMQGSPDGYYFVLKDFNQDVIFRSEVYSTRDEAESGIQYVQRHCDNCVNFEQKQSADQGIYFVLKTTDENVVGVSVCESSKRRMSKILDMLMINGVSEKIKDLTRKAECT